MEGGRDWWLQITDALDRVEFMVLVMTPAAMQSEAVRKEWRYARQRGVCVYPVQGVAGLDFGTLPRWMRDAHFYQLDQEWSKFVNDLNTRCSAPRVAFMVEDLPEDFVPRPNELEALVAQLVNPERGEPIAIAAALRGAGGYGKTTLARAVCHDERIQEAFDDGVLWVTLGETAGDLRGRVADLIEALTGERPGFEGIDAARTRLVELLADRDLLIVIDDVWNGAHLKPFMDGGPRCARLITTRNLDTLPTNARTVNVDAMQEGEAVESLSAGLPGTNQKDMRDLVARLGAWPLLLKLANGALRERVNAGETLRDALSYVNKALDKRGLIAFDARDAAARVQAVAKTLGVSLDLLSQSDRDRYAELAVFPEDANIPLASVVTMWRATAGLDEFDVEELCVRLNRLSLLLRLDLTTRHITLHDVMRKYLVHKSGDKLRHLHDIFLDASRPASGDWADLPEDPYLWDHLVYHLRQAAHGDELVETVKDLRYLAAKSVARGTASAESDITAAESHAPDDLVIRRLRRSFAQSRHVLSWCKGLLQMQSTLYSRLQHVSELTPLTERLARSLTPPFLTARHALPDLAHPAILRTLVGHTDSVNRCAISPDGAWIVSASADRTLKVWDMATASVRHTLSGHRQSVENCAVSPDGTLIVSASSDKTLKVWDARKGTERLTLTGHQDRVSGCAFSPDGKHIVSTSADKTLKIWDTTTGAERATFAGHAGSVEDCDFSQDGTVIVSASWDSTLKLWDPRAVVARQTLEGHGSMVNDCAVSVDGGLILSASSDRTLKTWNARDGSARLTLVGHKGSVNGCAISPDGSYFVSASSDRLLKVWDARGGTERVTLGGHTDRVQGCAVSPNGSVIVSASADYTLKVWDATSVERPRLSGHSYEVNSCAVSPDGTVVVSASSDWTLKVWDAVSGTERGRLLGHFDAVQTCAFSPDGESVVSASLDGTLKLWDATTCAERLTFSGHADRVETCAYSPDGALIVSGSWDHTLRLWDARTGSEVQTLEGHTHEVQACAISPDSRSILSAAWDGSFKLWDTATGAERMTFRADSQPVARCTFSPDGHQIVSGSSDGKVRVWDAGTGTERLTLIGHTNVVGGCAFSPDGRLIVSASFDATLRVWDAATGRCNAIFYSAAQLRDCAWFPDGSSLAAVGDGGVYFLRLVA
jgi:WD40 repeat protein